MMKLAEQQYVVVSPLLSEGASCVDADGLFEKEKHAKRPNIKSTGRQRRHCHDRRSPSKTILPLSTARLSQRCFFSPIQRQSTQRQALNPPASNSSAARSSRPYKLKWIPSQTQAASISKPYSPIAKSLCPIRPRTRNVREASVIWRTLWSSRLGKKNGLRTMLLLRRFAMKHGRLQHLCE